MSESPPPEDIPRDLPPLDPDLAAWLAQAPQPVMPEAVWDRLSAALAAEEFARAHGASAEAGGSVATLAEARGTGSRRRGRTLWPILAGAAGVVLVGAVAVPALRGGGGAPVADAPAPVASAETQGAVAGAPASPVPRSAPESADTEPADSAETSPTTSEPAPGSEAPVPDPTASGVVDAPADPAPEVPGSQQAEVPAVPVPMVLATGSEYTAASMADQVTALLADAGMTEPTALAAAMESPADVDAATPVGTDGFTSAPDVLRTCLDLLGATHGGAAPLIVDRALFSGQDVGVVVRLRDIALGQPADLDVLVVDPECTPEDVAEAQRFDVALPL